MSLPSMTTAFCLSGIAGLALTSAAMPPMGDGSTNLQMRCEMSARGAPCVPLHDLAETLGYPAVIAPGANRLRGHCETITAKNRAQASIELVANCAGMASSGSRLD